MSIAPLSLCAFALILTSSLSRAQAPAQLPGQLPEFEVASVKPNKTHERMYYGLRNSTLTIRNMPVKGLIQIAYGKRDSQITGGPAWITSECVDVDAKAESHQKANQDMLKSLLASRFQLKLHNETKETSVYSLVIARGGLKMKLAADQSEPQKGGPKEMGPGRLIGDGIPMYIIVNLLSNMLGRTVIDNTGLTGKYDIHLQPISDSLPAPTDAADTLAQADAVNIALIDAIEEQLGLKVKSIQAPETILVIDRIEHPSAN